MPVNSFDNYYMSWTPVLQKGSGSYVTQLIEQLQADIANRKLLPGTKLPPYRELADYLDVERSGLSAEIGKMCRENIIKCHRSEFTLLHNTPYNGGA